MSWVRWFENDDLLSQMERRLEKLQRSFGSPWSAYRQLSAENAGVFPLINIYDDGESYIARAEIPGVDPKDVDITVTGDTLTLRGKREIKQLEDECCYHRRERQSGEFRRAFTLPDQIDSSKVVANCTNGILEILLPRAEQAKQRKVEIKSS